MLTFAGVGLSLADPEGKVQAWIDRYRPLDNLFGGPLAYQGGRSREQGHWPHAIGLPTYNWNRLPPRWLVNTLWWPTGASRFAIGLFLTTKANLVKIRAMLSADGMGQLVIEDGDNRISPRMFMLPPRPIGAGTAGNPVVLLPLVDRRYFWQWSKCNAGILGPSSTWSNARTVVMENLGVSVGFTDPDGYEAPDWSEWARAYENAALALDGYAATVGQRFVAKLDGTYLLQTWAAAEAVVANNFDQLEPFAGGQLLASPCVAPGSVTVVFPRRQGGIVIHNGTCDQVVKAATEYNFSAGALGTATIHTTYQADYSTRSSQPDNQAGMNALANAIARDFYGWRRKQYSGCLGSVASRWTVTGFDDYLWFFANSQVQARDPIEIGDEQSGFEPDTCEARLQGPYLLQTFVESMLPNVGVEENLTQAAITARPRTFRPLPIWRAELTTGFSGSPSQATGRLLYDATGAGTLTKDVHNVKVFDLHSAGSGLKSGNKVWVTAPSPDSERFELVSAAAAGTFAIARLSGTLDAYNIANLPATTMPSASATVYSAALAGAAVAFTSPQVDQTIYNPTAFRYSNGDEVYLDNSAGFWIARRATTWLPWFQATVNNPATALVGGEVSWAGADGQGNVASLVGTNITIQCPVVQRRFRVRVILTVAYLSGFHSADYADATGTVKLNGVDQFICGPVLHQLRTPILGTTTSLGGDPAHTHTVPSSSIELSGDNAVQLVGEAVLQASQNDVIAVEVAAPGTSFVRNCALAIEPLF